MFPYIIDVKERVIFVPQSMEFEAVSDLTVQHIRNKFNFHIQLTIDDTIKPGYKKFDPVISEKKQSVQHNETELILPKRGEIWIKDNERLYFVPLPKDIFDVTFLGQLKGNKKITLSSVTSLVKSGKLVREITPI